VKVPRELYDAVERYAYDHRVTVSSLVHDGLRMRLMNDKQNYGNISNKNISITAIQENTPGVLEPVEETPSEVVTNSQDKAHGARTVDDSEENTVVRQEQEPLPGTQKRGEWTRQVLAMLAQLQPVLPTVMAKAMGAITQDEVDKKVKAICQVLDGRLPTGRIQKFRGTVLKEADGTYRFA